jgi:hypothetical protein
LQPKNEGEQDGKISIQAIKRSSTIFFFHERKIGSNQEHVILSSESHRETRYIVTNPPFLGSPIPPPSSQLLLPCWLGERLNIGQSLHLWILCGRHCHRVSISDVRSICWKISTISNTGFPLNEIAYLDLLLLSIMCHQPIDKEFLSFPPQCSLQPMRRLSGWLISIGTTKVDRQADSSSPDK